MKVIILAAGLGSRLKLGKRSKFAYSIPFLFLNELENLVFPIEDELLIENLFKNFIKDLDDVEVIFVLGYKFLDMVPFLSYLASKYGVKISYVVNYKFRSTNTSYSLYVALRALKENNYIDNIFIFNGDNYLSRKVWEKIKQYLKKTNFNENFIVVDTYKELTEESFKIKVNNNKEITSMGKELDIEESYGEFIGVSFIKKDSFERFYECLKELIKKNENSYYDLAFIEFSKKDKLEILELSGEMWTEIDFKEDLNKLKNILVEDYQKY